MGAVVATHLIIRIICKKTSSPENESATTLSDESKEKTDPHRDHCGEVERSDASGDT